MNNNHSCSAIGVLAIVVVLLLVIGILGIVWLPGQLEADFGKPDSRLNIFQRINYSLALYRHGDSLLSAPFAATEERKFTIKMSESVSSICARLESEGFVESGSLTCTYLIYSGLDRQIQSGTFTLPAHLNGVEVANRISDASMRDIVFTLFSGWRIEEIAQSIDSLGFGFDGDAFKAFAYQPPSHILQALNLPEGTSLEGYLFPGTYSLKPDISLGEMFATLLTEFTLATQDPTIQAGLAEQNLSLHQAITLASIIERETASTEEMATIASVFYNRLNSGMRLETDPTVQYAIGYDTNLGSWWKYPLTYEDLQVNSPYNTYLVVGLPPGPICNPSLETILAVAFPTQTPYYFFRAKCDGSQTHNFSITYEEHLNNACP